MKNKKRLLINWMLGLFLVLGAFYSAVAWLWKAAEESAATSLKNQVVSALSGELAEGNLFKLGSTLEKMGGAGQIRFAEIRAVRGMVHETIYRTAGTDFSAGGLRYELACDKKDRIYRVAGGVGVATELPGSLAGYDCVAAFIASDLPGDLKTLKGRITLSFGLIISALMLVVLLLTLAWHKKNMVFEVAARTAIAEKEAAIGRMAAQVAHDIRSPLAALSAAAKALEMQGGQRSLIDGAIGRIQDIADDLLTRYRSSSGSSSPALMTESLSLAPLIAQVIEEKRLQLRGRCGILIESHGVDAGIYAKVKPAEFQRLLSNLINNSVEALGKEGVITVGLSASGGRAKMEIRDNGRGIPLEIIARLGQKGETFGKSGGSGLGLYHARTTVESWGGSLKIGSKPGEGASVMVELPAPGDLPVPQLAVLIDDDALVRMNWKTAARGRGVELKAFAAPAEFFAAGITDTTIPLYIDSDLGGGVRGENVAADLREKGYNNITLETGHPPEKFASLPWLKVAGKEPPWA